MDSDEKNEQPEPAWRRMTHADVQTLCRRRRPDPGVCSADDRIYEQGIHYGIRHAEDRAAPVIEALEAENKRVKTALRMAHGANMLLAADLGPDEEIAALKAEVERLRGMVKLVQPALDELVEGPNGRFERLADAFQRATGMMRPGKDYPAAYGPVPSDEEREAAWKEWRTNKYKSPTEELQDALAALADAPEPKATEPPKRDKTSPAYIAYRTCRDCGQRIEDDQPYPMPDDGLIHETCPPKPEPAPSLADQLYARGWGYHESSGVWTRGTDQFFSSTNSVSYMGTEEFEPVPEPVTPAGIDAAIERLRARVEG